MNKPNLIFFKIYPICHKCPSWSSKWAVLGWQRWSVTHTPNTWKDGLIDSIIQMYMNEQITFWSSSSLFFLSSSFTFSSSMLKLLLIRKKEAKRSPKVSLTASLSFSFSSLVESAFSVSSSDWKKKLWLISNCLEIQILGFKMS